MKNLILLFAATLFCSAIGAAQVSYRGHGYGFWGFEAPSGGSLGDIMTGGAGGDYIIWRGVGIGGDAAYAFPRREPSDGIGLAAVHGSYHWVNQYNPRKFVPFGNAGYTLAFRHGTANFAHIGAGFIYWFNDKAGFRFEWRNTFNSSEHFLNGIRLGVTFR
jgi:hypothetical protein